MKFLHELCRQNNDPLFTKLVDSHIKVKSTYGKKVHALTVVTFAHDRIFNFKHQIRECFIDEIPT